VFRPGPANLHVASLWKPAYKTFVPAERVKLMTERRASRRYELSFPILVHATDFGQTCTYAGRTRNISTVGLHFILPLALRPGVAIQFTITIPTEPVGGHAFIHGAGTILRVADCRDQGYELASHFEGCEISRDK
jgi:PilZ domain-containing protein